MGLFAWIYLVHAQLRGKTKFSPPVAVVVGFIPGVGMALVPYVVFDALRVARGGRLGPAALVMAWWLTTLLALAGSSGSYVGDPDAGPLVLFAVAYGLLAAIVWRVTYGRRATSR